MVDEAGYSGDRGGRNGVAEGVQNRSGIGGSGSHQILASIPDLFA